MSPSVERIDRRAPGSSISDGQTTSIGGYASGDGQSIVAPGNTVNGTVGTVDLNKGLPVPDDQDGLMVVTADGHMIEY